MLSWLLVKHAPQESGERDPTSSSQFSFSNEHSMAAKSHLSITLGLFSHLIHITFHKFSHISQSFLDLSYKEYGMFGPYSPWKKWFFLCLMGKAKSSLWTQHWILSPWPPKHLPLNFSLRFHTEEGFVGVYFLLPYCLPIGQLGTSWLSAFSGIVTSTSTYAPDSGVLWLVFLGRDSTIAICLERPQPLWGRTPTFSLFWGKHLLWSMCRPGRSWPTLIHA